MKLIAQINSAYGRETTKNEDAPVLTFLESVSSVKNIRYLELGSGLGRFALIVKSKFPQFKITCLEVNETLAIATQKLQLNTVCTNVLTANIKLDSFEVIHCSHLIEHFGYPEVTQLLDKMGLWLKSGGYLIIRSPLLHDGFYDDIDHIRPYPPAALQNYFNNPQQQKRGKENFVTKLIWQRSEAIPVNNIFLRSICKFLWTVFRWPVGKPNGYVMVLQKK